MEASLLAPVVAALAALGGVALTAYVQSRIQAKNQSYLTSADREKYEREQDQRNRTDALDRLLVMHKLVSKLEREFSITTLNILWTRRTTKDAYDERYLAICSEADELRALAQLYEPTVYDDVERMFGEMNIFWGNFQNVLYKVGQGETVDHLTPTFADAHAVATKIQTLGRAVKSRLQIQTEEIRRRC